VAATLLELPDVPLVCVDVETSGLHPDDGARVSCVGVAWLEGGEVKSRGFPFDQGERDKLPAVQMDMFDTGEDPNLGRDEWMELLGWLESREVLVNHNLKFDLMMLTSGTRHWPGTDLLWRGAQPWDTMLVEKELRPTDSLSLETVGERYGLGGKTGSAELAAWLAGRGYDKGRYDLVPWDVAGPYVRGDVELTLSVYLAQLEAMGAVWDESGRAIRDEIEEGLQGKLDREMDLLRVLYLMERRGVAYDDAASLRAAEVMAAKAQELEKRLPFHGPKQARDYFFRQKGVIPMNVSAAGTPSLDEEQTRRMIRDGIEWAPEYAEASRIKRAVSMWYRGYPEKIGQDGRLRCVYKQAFVRSGRMSVERVQLQAVPKYDKTFEGVPHIRELLRPAEGKELWNLDLSQAELRVASQYAQCKRMLELLGQGADLHGITCQQVLGVQPGAPDWKAKRDIAKRLTFGGIFQIGGETFQATLGKLANIYLPVYECDQMVRTWRAMYPEFGDAYRAAERRAKAEGRVRLLAGTPWATLSWLGERDYPNTAWNRIVQGSLAEFLKLWLVEIERRWPGLMVLTVHDSVVLETDEGQGEEAAEGIAELGARMFGEVFRIEGKVDYGRWGE
jgi:DNA polymerase-1